MAQSPGKFGSSAVFLLVDGYNLISNKLKSLRYKVESVTEPSHGVGDVPEEHTPTGVSRAEIEQGGAFFDTTTNRIHTAMSASVPTSPQAAERVICFGFAGQTIGEPFVGVKGSFSVAYEVLADNGQLTKANVRYVVNGPAEKGTIIQALAAKTIDWNTKTDGAQVDYTLDTQQQVIPITSNSLANPSVVTTPIPHGLATGDIILISGVATSNPTINGQRTVTVISTTTFSVPVNVTTAGTGGSFVRANSSNGATGYQQVTDFSGFSGFVGKLRDSADDVTYADLISFANVTAAPAFERATVAGVVDRYMSYDGNVTGAGSITVFAGLCRS
jgi:hypothetical protein